jgi:hypothetical protein
MLLNLALAAMAFIICASVVFGVARRLRQPPTVSVRQIVDTKPDPAAVFQKRFTAQIQPLLVEHCYRCHGNGKHKGDLTLDHLTTVRADRKTWESVANMLGDHLMPPKERPQPTQAQVNLILGWIDEALAHNDASAPHDPGFVSIHRLNRNEYNNTIRDLVGVDFQPAADFPADDTGYGFDNIADVLTMSPLLLEKYLTAAEQILDKAIILDNPLRRRTIHYPGVKMDSTVGESADGSAWKLTIEGEAFKNQKFVADADYEIRVRAYGEQFGKEPPRMTLKLDSKELRTFDITAERRRPETFKYRLHVPAGTHRIAAAYINNAVDMNNPDPKLRGDRNLIVEWVEIDGPLDLPPPPAPQSHQRLLFTMPGVDLSEEQCARLILRRFASRAFRRPVTLAEVDALVKLHQSARAAGDRFEQAIKLPMMAVLVSPHFLFRIELDPASNPQSPHPLNDYELATRLSYFLWSSTPDDELLSLAESGGLRSPAVLEAQVQRMLADPRSSAFISNFAGQWLELRKLEYFKPDPARFPAFDDKLRTSMRREAELFFENIVRQDRSILEFLDADYSFLNEPLARHYGIAGVTGDTFQRVSLTGTHRGGVVTMAGVLAVTSMPMRTSPVKRGKFVLEQILGTPPPPPPADVPPLSEKPEDTATGSVRQRFERHRADPTCASCHMRMDPLGFSLENFDAVGAWRDRDGQFPIDAAGSLPGGQPVDGAAGLKRVLLAKKKDFVHCLAEKMLTYALGRGPQEHDRRTINEICRAAEQYNYRFSSLVLAIVKSETFQDRRGKRGDE